MHQKINIPRDNKSTILENEFLSHSKNDELS